MQNKNKTLTEGLRYKDLVGIIKPTIHIDEFSSKMGDDDEIIVVSFYLRNDEACEDLINWFEKGYDFVLDADRSPGEIKPNRFLVYVELKRRNSAVAAITELLTDLSSVTEHKIEDWVLTYDNHNFPYDQEKLAEIVPMSPKEYRVRKEGPLNEYRKIAGLKHKEVHDRDEWLKSIQRQAGM